MKQSDLLFLLVFVPYILNGQGLIDTSRTWNVSECCGPTKTKAYKFTGDTVINMNLYNKLYYSYSENFDESKKIYATSIREEGEKYYMVNSDTTETILYDFNLTKKDTFTLVYSADFVVKLVVDSIDSLQINSDYKKRIFFNEVPKFNVEAQIWIEEIGSTYGLIDVFSYHRADLSTRLLCVKESNILIYSLENFCYESNVSVENNNLVNGIIILPNISKEDFVMNIYDNREQKMLKIQIFDMNGKMVYQGFVKDKDKIKVPRQGVYLVKVMENGSYIKTFKIVKI